MTPKMYGITNCDTVKKARKWFEAERIDYDFHDYRKDGADAGKLDDWAAALGWEVLLNRRGTTYRGLSDIDKANIDRAKAVRLMSQHPSLIKRPVIEHDGGLLVGFDAAIYAAQLK